MANTLRTSEGNAIVVKSRYNDSWYYHIEDRDNEVTQENKLARLASYRQGKKLKSRVILDKLILKI